MCVCEEYSLVLILNQIKICCERVGEQVVHTCVFTRAFVECICHGI